MKRNMLFQTVQVRGKVKIADTGKYIDHLYNAVVIDIDNDKEKIKILVPDLDLTLWVDNWYIVD